MYVFRSLESQLFNKANELQEDISLKRFDQRVAQLHLGAIKAQVRNYFSSTLTYEYENIKCISVFYCITVNTYMYVGYKMFFGTLSYLPMWQGRGVGKHKAKCQETSTSQNKSQYQVYDAHDFDLRFEKSNLKSGGVLGCLKVHKCMNSQTS